MKQPGATLIGAFVLGAITLVVAAIVFFGSGTLFKKRFDMVSYFQGSVTGLRVGAPVTYRGVRVGEVKSFGIRIDPDPTQSIVQVNMQFIPEGVELYGSPAAASGNPIPDLVRRGLSARLVMQSIVTGQLQVDLDFRHDVHAARLGVPSDVPEVPTVPSQFQTLAQQLETVDIAGAVAALQHAASSLDALLTSPALKRTEDELPALLSDLRRTAGTIEREVAGSSAAAQRAMASSSAALQRTLASVQSLAESVEREAVGTLTTAQGALRNANTAIEGANVLLDPNGDTVIQLQHALDDFAATAARLRSLAERVDRNPAVLLRGR